MRPTTLLIALLLVAGAAAAQPGPEPGYASATDYAQDYVAERADQASSDPQGFVGSLDSPEEIEAEAEHTAYVACWAADDEGVESEACEPFYTPRGEAAPEQPEEPQEVEDFENATLNATQTFADEAADAVNDTIADPGSAPSQVERIIGAGQEFLASIGDAAAALADGLAGGVMAVIDGLVDGVEALEGVGIAAADGLVAGLEATADGLGAGATATTDGIATGGLAIGDGVAAATSATGDGLAKAGGAVADIAKATGDGIADAAKAVGEGIADVAHSVKDAVAGWFGADVSSQDLPGAELDAPVDVDDPAGGLLDGVTKLVE